jgi:hypothetical protein
MVKNKAIKVILISSFLLLVGVFIYVNKKYQQALKRSKSILDEIAPIIDHIFNETIAVNNNVTYTFEEIDTSFIGITNNNTQTNAKKYSYIDPVSGKTIVVDISETEDPSAYTISYFDESLNKIVTVRVAVKRV